MEIFQTIWTALTTENEVLTNIICIPLAFIEAAAYIYLAIALLNLKISKKKVFLFILIVPIISNITTFFFNDTLKVIINLISIPLSAVVILKLSLFKGLLIEFLPIVILLISETIWSSFFNIVLNIPANMFAVVPLYRIAMSSLDYSFIFFICFLSKKYKFNITLLDDMPKKSKTILITNSIIGLIAIVTQIYLVSFYSSTLPLFITIVGLLSLLAYFFISMYNMANTSKLAVATTNLEQEKENNKILKEMQDDLRGFRHDFSNILCTIGGYIQVKDMEGLSKYYSQIQKDVIKINNLGALNSDVINNPAVFVLISSKYNRALEFGIEMNINVFLDLNNLNMKIYEFTRILGILLDNSIEAARECDERTINIEIRKDSNRNRQLLIIENTYEDKDIDTEKIFEKKYSTKPGNSGLGLWEVRQILKKNNNLNLFTTKNDKFFKQQLEIYNK